eukprot:scaffold75801_cov57-Phaeocystis_antarctica.AAC.2
MLGPSTTSGSTRSSLTLTTGPTGSPWPGNAQRVAPRRALETPCWPAARTLRRRHPCYPVSQAASELAARSCRTTSPHPRPSSRRTP